ncbi:MAG: transglycosylase SLT domain-containing protein [Sulfuritalea sp.]|nr:transglycosylase SLT domain-containing protein [Sulfuritalea sp.]
MIRRFLALVSFIMVSTHAAWAGEEGGLRRQSFVYPPMALDEIGPVLKPEVHRGPVVDRRRAYLLDIAEEEFSDKQSGPIRNVWDRIRNGFSLPPLSGPLVAERELWYGQRKDLVANISQKARRYLFHIVEAVEKRGLPMELALLPFVESGFEPGALSTAQAAGLWQFIPGTAQRYNLKLTDQYDARRDILASTEAALDYLDFLHGIFKDWQLALAAYNWGEEAVLRAVQRNQAKGLAADYENLNLPEETRYYVPKLMAIRNIVMSPELHGVELADIPNTPYFAEIDVRVPLDIQSVARLAGLPASEVLALNPSHKSLYISGKGKPAVLLPADRIEAFAQKIADYPLKGKKMGRSSERKPIQKSVVGFKLTEERPL